MLIIITLPWSTNLKKCSVSKIPDVFALRKISYFCSKPTIGDLFGHIYVFATVSTLYRKCKSYAYTFVSIVKLKNLSRTGLICLAFQDVSTYDVYNDSMLFTLKHGENWREIEFKEKSLDTYLCI